MAKVLHSQRMREKPLRPWIIATKDGKVVAAHCNCMAGLGEACTHVAALLFSIEATVKIRNSKTVTETKAYWLLPSDCKSVSYKEVRDINYISAKTAKKQLDQKIESPYPFTPNVDETIRKSRNVTEATHSEFMAFADKLSKLNCKPALLSLIEPYAQKYVPKSDTKDFPKVLTDLRNDKLIGVNFKELVDECESIEIKCTKQQAEFVEQQTKGQADSPLWFKFRAGRITASKSKAVVRTDKTNPSQSLVKAICYPDSKVFHSVATKWGRDHEKTAREMFMKEIGPIHDNSRVEDSGFRICESYPFVGASPDGIFACDCCGSACVEVKCPFSLRNSELSSETCNYLTDTDGKLTLKNY